MKDGMCYSLSNGEYVPQYKPLSKYYNVPEDCLKNGEYNYSKIVYNYNY